MKVLSAAAPGRNRLAALAVFALMIVVPAVWVAWALSAASGTAETIRSQSVLLEAMRKRLDAKPSPAMAGSAAEAKSIYLPGETPAIAGAALQRLVADAVGSAGGRLVESEFAREEPSEDEPNRVDLRVAFDAEIVTLQQILFKLESSMPVLLIDSMSVQSSGLPEAADGTSPPLRVTLVVGGFWEPADGTT